MKTLSRVFLFASVWLVAFTLLGTPVLAQTDSADNQAKAQQELDKARELLKQGYTDSAIVSYQSAIKLDPELVPAYKELGELMLEQKNHAYAIKMYRELERLQPNEVQWKSVLLSLYETYEMPRDAIETGQAWLDLEPNNADVMRRLIKVYDAMNFRADQTEMMERLASVSEVDSQFYIELGKLYLEQEQSRKAIGAYQKAVDKDPSIGNQVLLSQAYMADGNFEKAESILQELADKNPNDPGVKEHLARIYLEDGDRYFSTRRYATAKKLYQKAQDLTGNSGEGADSTTVSDKSGEGVDLTPDRSRRLRGTGVVDSGDPFNGNWSPSLPDAGDDLGGALRDRVARANRGMRPYLGVQADFGQAGFVDYTRTESRVGSIIPDTEWTVEAIHRYADVSDPAGTAWVGLGFGRLNYNFDRHWSAHAEAGSEGLYRVGLLTEAEHFAAGLDVFRDRYYLSSLAIANDLKYTGTNVFGDWSINPWLSIAGNVTWANYNDGTDQVLYNIGPFVTLYEEPGDKKFGVYYNHSADINNQVVNPLLRFAPANLQFDTVGMEFRHAVNDWFRYRLGYNHTWLNDGTNGDSFLVGGDVRLGQDAFVGLDYERGFVPGGLIPVGQQLLRNDNDNLQLNVRVNF
ncbi:MAG: tetratricopeptide repeat protein [Candidatus Eremiobacteraeota bacterium]|nr:tetratricopeptide repeat protein [Candidatus Eremiobacteraeota bacterium]